MVKWYFYYIFITLQRSDLNEPLLTPNRAWEKGIYPYNCNVPNVIFLEAAVMFNEQQKLEYIEIKQNDGVFVDKNSDLIRVYFGGADAVIGTAVIQVSLEDDK